MIDDPVSSEGSLPQADGQDAPLPLGPIVVDASLIVGVLRSDAAAVARVADGVLERSVLTSVTCAEVVRVMYRLAALPPTS
ncbi:hypothetical protein SAMN06264364_105124 [Quadrisphaera granulorum]|uniref:PIN domain-containing protein n=1 Tax=Quadrisphaera granulorum TaxID=317664 RepID=A0A316AAW1_9ACTN|nr:hypothetical protein [Quadrisphaera granulorum]PWJ54915.1 hypothetical protein BXY45_105124 [Quadrisphaera granulorum]SZE95861.1 hypothetical protein SAMN06264364_105124 [Quadrisphaera granulorum]